MVLLVLLVRPVLQMLTIVRASRTYTLYICVIYLTPIWSIKCCRLDIAILYANILIAQSICMKIITKHSAKNGKSNSCVFYILFSLWPFSPPYVGVFWAEFKRTRSIQFQLQIFTDMRERRRKSCLYYEYHIKCFAHCACKGYFGVNKNINQPTKNGKWRSHLRFGKFEFEI